jgi:aspartyl aminopeptidase
MKQPSIIQDLISFLDSSPTAWHAVTTAKKRLKHAGFKELSEQEAWHIQPKQNYIVTRNGSSLCAFITPSHTPKRLRLLASHTDSPSLKLKPRSEIRKYQAILLGVEVYGSPLLSSWLNRDLGLAGRILYTNRNGEIRESLVRLERHPMTIPQLAIHLDREVNERGLQLNKQEHLNVLAGLESSFNESSFIEELVREEIDFDQLIGHDLLFFPLEKARLLGYEHALLAAYRIDSLASVHAALTALLQQPDPLEDEIKMIIFWDNEEVGSHTAQGAESPFFSQILERILAGFKATREDYFCLLNRSTCISIDLAHALHPNYADKHDAQHQPILGQGVVLKNNAQQRYATSARSSLPVQMVAALKQLSLQRFVSRNDIPCGTTIGPLQACLTGMATADIGCGQLSMHACRELMSCQDHLDMCQLLGSLLQTPDWPQVVEESINLT